MISAVNTGFDTVNLHRPTLSFFLPDRPTLRRNVLKDFHKRPLHVPVPQGRTDHACFSSTRRGRERVGRAGELDAASVYAYTNTL